MITVIDGPSRALRERSTDLLRAELLRMLRAYDKQEVAPDIRDLLWSLAPYHDCSTRLGLDPAILFDAVAEAGPQELQEAIRDFGRRTDTSPEEFGGYALMDTPQGPCYVWR